jgi:hypothetical protein
MLILKNLKIKYVNLVYMLTDANQNTSKYIDKFYCEICDFGCSKKGDYSRHLTTRKHIKLTNANSDANASNIDENPNTIKMCPNRFICECGTTFSHKSSLSRHKKKCSETTISNTVENKAPTSDTVSMDQFVDVVNKCVKLSEDNQALTKKVIELVEKPSVVNNNTQNVNNVFNLNVFLNENCKDALNLTDFVKNLKLQLEDLENMGKLGFVDGMSNIIIKGLEELDVDKRPIHCTDARRDVLYIKENDIWEKDKGVTAEKISSAMEDIKKKNVQQMQQWVEKYPAARNGGSQKGDEYHKIVSNMFGCNGDPGKNTKKIMKNIAKHTSIHDAKKII